MRLEILHLTPFWAAILRQRVDNGSPPAAPANDKLPGWQEVERVVSAMDPADRLPFLAHMEQLAKRRQGPTDQEALLAIQEWRRIKGYQ